MKRALAQELTRSRALCGNDHPVLPSDIVDVDVIWDDGDQWDPCYGASRTPPRFEVWVTLSTQEGKRRATVDTTWMLTTMLRGALEIGDPEAFGS